MRWKLFEECNTLNNCKVEKHFYKPPRNYHHLVRHAKNCVDSLFERAYSLFGAQRLGIQIHEWLFNMHFENLWRCITHASFARDVNACHKWIHWLKDNTLDKLESIYYVLWDILRHVFPRNSWDEDSIPLKSCLEDLDTYIDAFKEMVQIVDFIRQISESDYVKRHKNYLLRQLWKRARDNPLVIKELKRGYGPYKWKLRTCLNLFEVLKQTKEAVDFWLRFEINEVKETKAPFQNVDFLINWEHFWKHI